MPGKLQPLVSDQPIINPDGTPTLAFIRWAQQRQIDIGEGISLDEAEALFGDHSITAGTGLSGGGALSTDPTINLDASLGDLNDVDFTTPPTDGQVIVWDEAAGKWVPADQSGGGGGGSGGYTLLSDTSLAGLTDLPIAVPAGCTALRMVVTGTATSGGGDVQFTINGNTAAIYDSQRLYAKNGAISGDQTLGQSILTYTYSFTNSGGITSGVFDFLNPSDTANRKAINLHSRQGQDNDGAYLILGTYQIRDNTAIASIQLHASGFTWAAGSRVQLYGVKPSSGGGGSDLLGYAYAHNEVLLPSYLPTAGALITDMSVTFVMPADGLFQLNWSMLTRRGGGNVRIIPWLDGAAIPPSMVDANYYPINQGEYGVYSGNAMQIYPATAGSHTVELHYSDAQSIDSTRFGDRSMTIRLIA